MIVTDLDHMRRDVPGPFVEAAAAFLADAVRSLPPDGRVSLDGERVYAIIQSYTTRLGRERPRFEAHRRYLDIQFVLDGFELCGWAPAARLAVEVPYDESKDIMFGRVGAEDVVMMPFPAGRALVFHPWDAHAPGLAAGGPAPVRKAVIKIAV